jgi:hypothetical protein
MAKTRKEEEIGITFKSEYRDFGDLQKTRLGL